ncbi:hypothetical protein JCM24511_06937 [Saitozyma sp. JCM 24511]|nr:hypothetical protein JCM24511_06937 [Saitozyma sp. JCM 24511]
MFPGLPFYDGLDDYTTLHETHSEAFGTHVIESIPTSETNDQLATKASEVLGIEVPSSSSMRGDSKDARATRLLYCLQSLLANGRIKKTDSLSLVTARFHFANQKATDAERAIWEPLKKVINTDALAASSSEGSVASEAEFERKTSAYWKFNKTHNLAFKHRTGSLEERAAAATVVFSRVRDVQVPASEELFSNSHEGRIQRRLLCLQARNPSQQELADLYASSLLLASLIPGVQHIVQSEGIEDEDLDPDCVWSTIVAMGRFVESRGVESHQGERGGQSSACAQSSVSAMPAEESVEGNESETDTKHKRRKTEHGSGSE